MNSSDTLTTAAVTKFISNVATVAIVRHIEKLDGINPFEWERYMIQRVGRTAILRILFSVFKTIFEAGLNLDEILADFPPELIDYMQVNDIMPHHTVLLR